MKPLNALANPLEAFCNTLVTDGYKQLQNPLHTFTMEIGSALAERVGQMGGCRPQCDGGTDGRVSPKV